ncbi:PilT/PilU family type 4a pilus ATPase [candidate division FCPU426 bacterium]|nr:PilT/PilU family type 4a pilus ATPase [candidate division FCPU426 bacterium]
MLTIDTLVRMLFEKNASDLHLTAGAEPALRIDGEIVPAELDKLKPELCGNLIYSVLTDEQRDKLQQDNELTISFGIEKIGRVRMNIFKQRGQLAANLRRIPNDIISIEELGLPAIVVDIVQLPKGLVLVTGPSGSGKSSTLAAMLNWINHNKAVHILTIEEPIEFLYGHHKAIVNQREVGSDTRDITVALKRALRSDPDVVLIGELQERTTIQEALNLAETGHLVFASMQTTDSVQAIYKLLDAFEQHQQFRVRMQLSIVLQAILAQQLLPRGYSSGRALACEVLIPTSAVRNLIREEKEHQIYPVMQTGSEYGMQTMNQALFELYQKQLVTYNEIFSRTTDPRDLQQLIKGTT